MMSKLFKKLGKLYLYLTSTYMTFLIIYTTLRQRKENMEEKMTSDKIDQTVKQLRKDFRNKL